MKCDIGKCEGTCEKLYLHNFKRYWKEHLVHTLTGFVAGMFLTSNMPLAGAAIITTIWVRQGLEYHKRNDTPGIDLAYHLGGLVAGSIVGAYMRHAK